MLSCQRCLSARDVYRPLLVVRYIWVTLVEVCIEDIHS